MRSGSDFGLSFTPRPVFDATEAGSTGLMSTVKGSEPALKAIARTNIEWMKFASQRAQAMLGVPARVAVCRTPHDLMNEQVRFWQTAFEQYAETTRQVAAAWSAVNPAAQLMADQFEIWQRNNNAAKAHAAEPTHDFVPSPANSANSRDDRRVTGWAA